jgi:hypothetical protein
MLDDEFAHTVVTILHTYPTQSDAIRTAALAYMNDQPISR